MMINQDRVKGLKGNNLRDHPKSQLQSDQGERKILAVEDMTEDS